MKYTCTTALLAAAALAAGTVATPAFGNPLNDGTVHILSTDTNYNGSLYVGIQNPDNELLIQGGATVEATDVVVGQLSGSTNNTVDVSGNARLVIGGADTNGVATGGIIAGGSDGETVLDINSDSTVATEYLYLGNATNESGSIKLSGNGTELDIQQDAFIGAAGSDNTVEISAGAALNVEGALAIGSAGSSNNYIRVIADGSLYVNETNRIQVVNVDDGNGIEVKRDGTLHVGGSVNTATLEEQGIDLQAHANLELGGTLTLNQNRIDDRLNIILNGDLSTNTASWSSESLTMIGASTSDNSLTFTDGATGQAGNIVQVGQGTSAHRNELNVSGTNSLFTADSNVFVGAQGDNNELNIGDGAQMDIAGTLYLGSDASAVGNKAHIDSNGSLNITGNTIVGDAGGHSEFNSKDGSVTIGGNLLLGNRSANNAYNQTGGTNTIAGKFIIGATGDATGDTGFVNNDSVETTGNLAIIGTNATLKIEQDLTVGMEGGGSIMTVRDGGMVEVDGDTVIGEAVGDNYIYLQRDADTALNVAGDLVVGKEGGSNRFAVYGGTATIDQNLYLGATTNQHDVKNFIHLETTNAALTVAGAIHIGASNSLNTLDIVDGATVSATDLMVGRHEGVSDNVVTVTGPDALLQISNGLDIGSVSGTDNSVVVEDGGILNIAQTGIDINGTNNLLKIADGGTLKTFDWDYALVTGSATNILFESGSTLHLLGMLSGTNRVDGGMNVVLDGTSARWDTGTNDLLIGSVSTDNSLTITNGASASTSNNLYIGSLDNTDHWPNTLSVVGGSSLNVGQDAFLGYASVLKIDSTSQVHIDGNYEQGNFSVLEIGISSNQVQPNLLVEKNAEFSGMLNTNYPIIRIFNQGVGESNIITMVQAGSITVDGENATSSDIKANIATNLLFGFNLTVSNDLDYSYIILDDFIMRKLGETIGLEGQLLAVADEIEALNATSMLNTLDGLDTAAARKAMDDYYGEKKSSTPAHNAINMGIQSVAEQLNKRADNTRARMGAARSAGPAPAGAQGPHMQDQELQGWMTGFKTWSDRSADGGFDGYDGDVSGFLVGADLAVADGILVGVAGGSGRASLDKDNGGSTDTDTKYASVYASAGTLEWFADASLIYGSSSVDNRLGSVFDTTADYDAQNVAVYLGGGREIIGRYLIFTPQASLLGNYYSQDGYEETSTTALPRSVDSMDTFYLQGAIGGNVSFYTAMGDIILKPELRAFWLHEFNAKEEDVAYSLVGGTGSYNLQLQSPESDIIKLGGGVSARLGEFLEVRADLDIRRAGSYSDHTLLGSIRYQF